MPATKPPASAGTRPNAVRCPRDGRNLTARSAADVAYLFCESCHGLWLAKDSLSALALGVAGGASGPRSRPRLAADLVREGTARCLCARGPLMLNVHSQGVSLDRCRECGAVWLDGGEFSRVLEHYVGSRGASTSGRAQRGAPYSAHPFEGVSDSVWGFLELLALFG